MDYMGSSILMGIFSNADLKLQDEWKVNLCSALDSSISDKRYSGNRTFQTLHDYSEHIFRHPLRKHKLLYYAINVNEKLGGEGTFSCTFKPSYTSYMIKTLFYILVKFLSMEI